MNKAHLFRPGKDKWKRYFTKEHINIVKQLGYEDLLSELGYNADLNDIDNTNIYNDIGKYYDKKMKHILSLLDYLGNVDFKRDVHFPYDTISYHISDSPSNMKMLTNNAEFLNAYNTLMSSNLINKLIHSLI
ncbi:hypothetical protein MCHI_002501 [Candidatus Magnetoovum chiemensis]|nr:hypothetical protein MCHI_002501 [Candidatus Magnetoovum chiemensis]